MTFVYVLFRLKFQCNFVGLNIFSQIVVIYRGLVPECGGTPFWLIFLSWNGTPVNIFITGRRNADTAAGCGRGRPPPAVAVLAIDKAGPRPCHFSPGPTSGPATRPGSQKSKISTEKIQYV